MLAKPIIGDIPIYQNSQTFNSDESQIVSKNSEGESKIYENLANPNA